MNRTRVGPFIEIDGEAVRYRRIYAAGLTVAKLAEQCCVSAPYISMIELGKRDRVGPAMFKRLCEALHVEDPSVLLAHQPELNALTK